MSNKDNKNIRNTYKTYKYQELKRKSKNKTKLC